MQLVTTRPSYRYILLSLLAALIFVLGACGEDQGQQIVAEPDVQEEAVTDTEEATVVPEEEVEAEAEVETDADVAEVITETEVMTDTDVVAETDIITESEVTTVVTETVVLTDTDVETEVETETSTVTETLGSETETATITETTDTEADTEADTEVDTQTETETDAQMFGIADSEGLLVLASTLFDFDFENLDGEVSGEIEDLLIDLNANQVLAASIEYGGFLDIGDRELLLPLNAFALGPEGQLILNFDEQALESFPEFDDDWPNFADPTWDDEFRDYWAGLGIEPWSDYEATEGVVWASEIIGYGLADVGAGAGAIADLIIDLNSGRVRYVLADYGTGALLVLPADAVNMSAGGEVINLDESITGETLQSAPQFDSALYGQEETIGEEFDEQMRQFWQELGIDIEE